ncbi:MAG: hypothetical protein DDT24_00037 [Chloroflexi bacterium]|nr:hypothetical protein [Chloroflexota bacterium]
MSLKDEQGQALVYVLIYMVVGLLLLALLVPLLDAGVRRQLASRELVMAGYAAEAGVSRVMADLIRGADALSLHYTVPKITVNRHTPTIVIHVATIALPSEQTFVDPGVRDPYLRVIPAGEGYLMRLHHVKPGELRVNWAYSPAGLTRLGIWKGTPGVAGRIYAWPGQEPLAMAESSRDYNHISVNITGPGIYTIVFFNPGRPVGPPRDRPVEPPGGRPVVPPRGRPVGPPRDRPVEPPGDRPVGPSKETSLFGRGGIRYTWIYVRAHQDYVITATAGEVSVSAFVRQVPGFSEPHFGDKGSWITNEVSVYSWRPP